MRTPRVIHRVPVAPAEPARPRVIPALLKSPAALPQRPLVPNYFKPPKGQKQVFLPNFVIKLVRSPHLPPHYASFSTPLWFNKFDLKDYLYNLYGVQVLSVRSTVIQQKVMRSKKRSYERVAGKTRWCRPQSKKKMTIEMPAGSRPLDPGQGPFLWPEEPDDLGPWGRLSLDETIQNLRRKHGEKEHPKKWSSSMRSVADMADEMLAKRAQERQVARENLRKKSLGLADLSLAAGRKVQRSISA